MLVPAGSTWGGPGGDEWTEALQDKARIKRVSGPCGLQRAVNAEQASKSAMWEPTRHNNGDRVAFEQIEHTGVNRWLDLLRQELAGKTYRCQPLLRVWIPKANGGQRPLGIPTIRDRVVQMAMLIVLAPIFEADLCDEQYGFRGGVDAKMAIRRTFFHVTERALFEVVDADLSDYFNTIPHGR
jgi:retron-type reverse transcriptase